MKKENAGKWRKNIQEIQKNTRKYRKMEKENTGNKKCMKYSKMEKNTGKYRKIQGYTEKDT